MRKDEFVKFQPFKDGTCQVFKAGEVSPAITLPFDKISLSQNRYFKALSAEVKLTRVIKVPLTSFEFEENNCVEILGKKYVVKIVQEDYFTRPPSVTLSLGVMPF